jgi:hypothetical protein
VATVMVPLPIMRCLRSQFGSRRGESPRRCADLKFKI